MLLLLAPSSGFGIHTHTPFIAQCQRNVAENTFRISNMQIIRAKNAYFWTKKYAAFTSFPQEVPCSAHYFGFSIICGKIWSHWLSSVFFRSCCSSLFLWSLNKMRAEQRKNTINAANSIKKITPECHKWEKRANIWTELSMEQSCSNSSDKDRLLFGSAVVHL